MNHRRINVGPFDTDFFDAAGQHVATLHSSAFNEMRLHTGLCALIRGWMTEAIPPEKCEEIVSKINVMTLA